MDPIFFWSVLISGFILGYVIYVRVTSIKHEGVCVRYWSHWMRYEYELVIAGKTIKFENTGLSSTLFPREGKRYKILIRKNNYSKVEGYSYYLGELFWSSLFFLFFVTCTIICLVC